MLYQTLWCLPLPDSGALPLFQRLLKACRRATQQHPPLGVALLFSGSTVLLMAEGDAAGVAAVANLLQALGLPPAPEAALAMHTQAGAEPSPPALPPGQCRVGYLDGEDCSALRQPVQPWSKASDGATDGNLGGTIEGPTDGPTDGPSDCSAEDKVAAFWRLWSGADRG